MNSKPSREPKTTAYYETLARDAIIIPSVPACSTTCPVCGAHETKGKHLKGCKNAFRARAWNEALATKRKQKN